jgi:hypothetical protein
LLPFSPKLFAFSSTIKNVQIRVFKTTILSAVSDGCETCSVTLQKEHRLIMFEDRVLRRISGTTRGELTGSCRKLHNQQIQNLCSSADTVI